MTGWFNTEMHPLPLVLTDGFRLCFTVD